MAALDRLNDLDMSQTRNDAFVELYGAKYQMEQLFGQSVYSPYLRTSREKADKLFRQLTAATELPSGDPKWDMPLGNDLTSMRSARDNFRMVFLSEISTLPVFLVDPKDNYDVTMLIERGHRLFPPAMLSKAPEAAYDAGEVGKALAFQLPTACGFHTFRVVECVLRRYWDVVTNGDERPDPATIGKMSADLINKNKGDAKVLECLKQFAKLHRNPCVHPDVALTEEEAIGTLGLSRSLIAGMLTILPDAPPPTTVASSTAQP